MPSKRLSVKSVLIGGVIASILFEILQFINIFIAKNALATDRHIYGTMPIIAVLFFVWIRLIWLVILIGASFSIAAQRIIYYSNSLKQKIYPTQGFINCLIVYKTILKRFKTKNLPSSTESIIKISSIGKQEVEAWIDYLHNKNIICISSSNSKEILYLPSYKSLIEEQKNPLFFKKFF